MPFRGCCWQYTPQTTAHSHHDSQLPSITSHASRAPAAALTACIGKSNPSRCFPAGLEPLGLQRSPWATAGGLLHLPWRQGGRQKAGAGLLLLASATSGADPTWFTPTLRSSATPAVPLYQVAFTEKKQEGEKKKKYNLLSGKEEASSRQAASPSLQATQRFCEGCEAKIYLIHR